MTTNKRPPLLSDEYLRTYQPDPEWPDGPMFHPSSITVRDIYEAARAKDAELIQRMRNALASGHGYVEARYRTALMGCADDLAAEIKADLDELNAAIDAADKYIEP